MKSAQSQRDVNTSTLSRKAAMPIQKARCQMAGTQKHTWDKIWGHSHLCTKGFKVCPLDTRALQHVVAGDDVRNTHAHKSYRSIDPGWGIGSWRLPLLAAPQTVRLPAVAASRRRHPSCLARELDHVRPCIC